MYFATVASAIERTRLAAKNNRWYRYFYLFCRLSLAFGFVAAGVVKITGERFASGLSPKHPMGAYLVALHHTGFYYTFIGIAQVVAAVLLLFRRTVTLGALLYFSIIINIWVLSVSVRFDGSFISAPLMVLANLFILLWNIDKLRPILWSNFQADIQADAAPEKMSNRFPWRFFVCVAVTLFSITVVGTSRWLTMPKNSLKDCLSQFASTQPGVAECDFCDCIHKNGKPLPVCLDALNRARAARRAVK